MGGGDADNDRLVSGQPGVGRPYPERRVPKLLQDDVRHVLKVRVTPLGVNPRRTCNFEYRESITPKGVTLTFFYEDPYHRCEWNGRSRGCPPLRFHRGRRYR